MTAQTPKLLLASNATCVARSIDKYRGCEEKDGKAAEAKLKISVSLCGASCRNFVSIISRACSWSNFFEERSRSYSRRWQPRRQPMWRTPRRRTSGRPRPLWRRIAALNQTAVIAYASAPVRPAQVSYTSPPPSPSLRPSPARLAAGMMIASPRCHAQTDGSRPTTSRSTCKQLEASLSGTRQVYREHGKSIGNTAGDGAYSKILDLHGLILFDCPTAVRRTRRSPQDLRPGLSNVFEFNMRPALTLDRVVPGSGLPRQPDGHSRVYMCRGAHGGRL